MVSVYCNERALVALLILFIIIGCRRDDAVLIPDEVKVPPLEEKMYTVEAFKEVSIDVAIDGTYYGQNAPDRMFNLSANRKAYAHPDIHYFPNGFNGYQYWMVFTPYFGVVSSFSKPSTFENPTVVVSNDAVHWSTPMGLQNPLVKCPAPEESFGGDPNDTNTQGYWSDVDIEYVNDRFYLFYRSSWVTAGGLKGRGAASANNQLKLKGGDPQRAIVRQTSTDGVHWDPLEVCYTSALPHSPPNNLLLSPTYLYDGKQFVSYEVLNNNSSNYFPGDKPSYVLRRSSIDGLDFTTFQQSEFVNFDNEPWLKKNVAYAPWHIQACMIDGYYFMLINIGIVKSSKGEALYLAYSKDGVNFKVLDKSLEDREAYRSCLFPIAHDKKEISLGMMIASTRGTFRYAKLKFLKEKMIN
ncbi:hypothetical protein [Sphingobacterium sp. SYP-B4668]|uniref:hypothetical protein n=1 Tax=Sphingobacterium sp. SYP-B4668 TaxID=2996035 RepID=UPI0022DD8248|nr:hypothetical protein [Sphingobacterium sp. SYP-B4668]